PHPPHHPRRALGGEVVIPRVVLAHVETGPVVEAGAPAGLLVGIEPQRADEPEGTPGRDAGAPDVAGVVGDLRLVQDDLEQGGRRSRGRARHRLRFSMYARSAARRALTPGSRSMQLSRAALKSGSIRPRLS